MCYYTNYTTTIVTINNLKFYSTTNEPQQKASADDENGAAQLLDNGFQMSAVMVEELDAPEGLGSFGPFYGFGDAPFGAGANKPTTTAESHSPPSSSTVDGVEEDDYAGNTSTSMDKYVSSKTSKMEYILAFRH